MSLTAQEVRQRVISQMKSQKPKGQFNESMFPSSQVCSFSHNSRIINLNSVLTKGQIRGEKIMNKLN